MVSAALQTAIEATKESRVAFAVSPATAGIVTVFFAIPSLAWPTMQQFRSSEFDLVPHGIPLQMMMTRCKDRHEGIRFLRARGVTCDVNPKAKEDWILLATGQERHAQLILIMIPDAAKRGLTNKGQMHTFNLVERGIPAVVRIIARETHADCMEAIKIAIGSMPIRDISDYDISFVDPNQSTARH